MKKFMVSIVALCLIFSLTSCGNDADKPITEQDLDNWTEKEFEDALLELESADEAADAADVANQETGAPEGSSFEAKQEIIDAAWDSGLVQIDDKLIQLPIHLSEWIDLGLDYEIEYGLKSKDFLFTQDEKVVLDLVVNGETVDSLIFTKKTETPETVVDMDPLIEKFYTRITPENSTMYIPGGLKIGDSYTSIEEKLGQPTEIDENLTYKYGQIGSDLTDLHYGINIYVNRNTQTIFRFEIGKNVQESNREDLTMISFEDVPNSQTSDIHNVTLLWLPEYKQIPGFTKQERCVDSVLNDNGKKYYMSLSFGLSGQQYANPYEYIAYGDPILDETDENGINRKVYNAGYAYVVVCSTDAYIFEADIKFKDMSDSSEGALADLQDLVFEITNSIQF